MATKQTDYLISERMVSGIFVASAAGMVLALMALFLVATARPQGRLVNVNDTQFVTSRDAALENISTYGETEDGRITIDVRRAMDLLVERGLN